MKTRVVRNQGSALAYVMMALVVVFVLVALVASIAQTNITQAGTQEKGLEAYYIARSGAETAYEAIMTTTPSMLDEFKAEPGKVVVENGVDFEKGTADIRVTSSGTGDDQKIIIRSVGKLKARNVSRTVTLEFYINYDKKPGMVWSR